MGFDHEDEGSTSKFNAGMLQMQRLHALQDKLNSANTNQLAFNYDFGVYNYELVLSCCYSLWQEVNPKLGKNEKKELLERYKSLKKFSETYPIFTVKKSRDGVILDKKVNEIHWKIFSKGLIDLELKIREFMDAHSLNSPNDDDDGL